MEEWIAYLTGVKAPNRYRLWVNIIEYARAANFLEVGVFRGDFAQRLLRNCPSIRRYYMLDPWRHLDEWNKPANVEQNEFDEIYALAMKNTDFARDRRIVLRGTTVECIDAVPDEDLDIAYIDGDHTLRGIAIDLIRTFSKVKPGGILGGDDYTKSIWQHGDKYEPSLVCPFANYFAEAHGAPLIILPYNQFAIVKPDQPGNHFRIVDITGSYGPPSLLRQMAKRA